MDEYGESRREQLSDKTLERGNTVQEGTPARSEALPGPAELLGLAVEVVGGPMDGQRCAVQAESLSIGRGDGNDLRLSLDPRVSARHARIVREGDHYWLEDLESTNGTFLGDRRIRDRTLIGTGTLFIVGRTSLEFSPR